MINIIYYQIKNIQYALKINIYKRVTFTANSTRLRRHASAEQKKLIPIGKIRRAYGMHNKIIQNLRETLLLFGSFPGTECIEENGGVFYCSYIPSAGENYLLLPPDKANLNASLLRGIAFFKDRDTPFICPVSIAHDESTALLLENLGMRERARLTGMIRNLKGYETKQEETPPLLSSSENPERLANALWRAFDSDDCAPEQFISFIQGALSTDKVNIYALQQCGEIAAITMLTKTQDTAGIYYVATLPAFRRKGLGQKLMDYVLSDAKAMGYEYACLLATPSGHPLYLKCGFADVFSSSVYSYATEL